MLRTPQLNRIQAAMFFFSGRPGRQKMFASHERRMCLKPTDKLSQTQHVM